MASKLRKSRDRPSRVHNLAIFLAAFAAILIVVFLSTQQVRHERRLTEQNVWRENRARVQSFEQYVLRTLAVADVALKHVDDLTGRNADGTDGSQFASDRTINSPLFTAVIVDVPGEEILTNRPSLAVSATLREQFRSWALQNGSSTPVVSPPIDFGPVGPQVGLIQPLSSVRGGYAVVLLDPRRFTDFADHVTFKDDDLISLIGLDGITRARRTGDTFSTGEALRGLVMEQQSANPDGDYVGPSVLDGIPRYFSHERLQEFGLFATSGIPTSTVDERVRDRRNVQMWIMVAAIAAILACAWIIHHSIHRNHMRLDDLLQANRRLNEAQRIGATGDWDYYPATNHLHWSENMRRMYGRAEDEAVSRLSDVSEYMSAADAAWIEQKVLRIFETAKGDRWDVRVRLADGSESHRRVIAVPILDDDGKVVGIHGTDQDVTHEATIREMEKRLTELARLDSMGALTATLAHELNQPLGIAANYLAAASRSLANSEAREKTADYLQAARTQIEHLAQIIIGARELVSHSGSSTQRIDLLDLFEDVISALREAVPDRDIEMNVELGDDARYLGTNRAQLKQVLFNLGRNSIEAVLEDRKPTIRFNASRENDHQVRVTVSDNGPGFPKRDGDPFGALVTSKPAGLGLGLALARTIVEFHGGKIWIEESSPNGTTIAFTVEADVEEDHSETVT